MRVTSDMAPLREVPHRPTGWGRSAEPTQENRLWHAVGPLSSIHHVRHFGCETSWSIRFRQVARQGHVGTSAIWRIARVGHIDVKSTGGPSSVYRTGARNDLSFVRLIRAFGQVGKAESNRAELPLNCRPPGARTVSTPLRTPSQSESSPTMIADGNRPRASVRSATTLSKLWSAST